MYILVDLYVYIYIYHLIHSHTIFVLVRILYTYIYLYIHIYVYIRIYSCIFISYLYIRMVPTLVTKKNGDGGPYNSKKIPYEPQAEYGP